MLLTTMSILLILWKEKGFLHTINVSLYLYFLRFPVLLVCSPIIARMKLNAGPTVRENPV